MTAVDETTRGAEAPPRPAEQPPGRPRSTWFGVLLGVALLAAGVGAWMLGAPPERAVPRLLAANQPVNAGAKQPADITANNSPTLARNPVDPRNLVVSNRIDLPMFSCALHATFDGAATWQKVNVPFPAGEEDPPRCYAPDVAYSPDGTLHMSFVTLRGIGNVPNALWVVSSTDGGRTLSTPAKAAGALAFQAQITADPADSKRLYLHWLQAEATGSLLFPNTGNPIVTSTSIDGGATWSRPVDVSSPTRQRVVAPSPAVGPKGEMYVLYLDLLEDRLDYAGAHEGRGGAPHEGKWALVLARSTDRGNTWEETLVDGEIVPTERFIVFLPPTPALAVDPGSGRIYASFTDGRRGDPDVHLWTSKDGGKTFGPPVRVNDTPPGDKSAQYLPRLDVAPGGRLDIVYFDRRADATNVFNEVSIQSSFDKGSTFGARAPVSDKRFDSRIGPGSERELPDLGSRLALLSADERALVVWPDTRGGSEITSKQDLASAVVDIPEPAASRSWLRWLGGLVAALGLVSLVLTFRSMRSQSAAGRAASGNGPGKLRKRSRGGAVPAPAVTSVAVPEGHVPDRGGETAGADAADPHAPTPPPPSTEVTSSAPAPAPAPAQAVLPATAAPGDPAAPVEEIAVVPAEPAAATPPPGAPPVDGTEHEEVPAPDLTIPTPEAAHAEAEPEPVPPTATEPVEAPSGAHPLVEPAPVAPVIDSPPDPAPPIPAAAAGAPAIGDPVRPGGAGTGPPAAGEASASAVDEGEVLPAEPKGSDVEPVPPADPEPALSPTASGPEEPAPPPTATTIWGSKPAGTSAGTTPAGHEAELPAAEDPRQHDQPGSEGTQP